MAATGATLLSLGEIAHWIDESVSKMLTGVVTPLIASITEKIMPFVGVGVSIALLWYAWQIMNGTIQTPILQATKRMVSIVAIVSVAGAGGLYQTEIASAMLELPSDIAKLFTSSVKTPSQLMDDTANNGAEIGTRLQERAPSGIQMIGQTVVFTLIALIITMVSAIMSALGMMVLITVKMGMGLVVVLGPFCILALLFEPTKDFFMSWLKQALFYTFYAGLYMLVFVFTMGMFSMLQEGLLNSTKADEINIFSMLTAVVFFLACAKYMLEQTSNVARITGGTGSGMEVPMIGKIG